MDILQTRLQNQYLLEEKFATPVEAVQWFGAMQAQDYAAVKWSLGQRVTGATEASIEAALDRGDILRTHVLRPTWHLVLPQDIRWMLQLTAPRVRALMKSYDRKLEIDDDLVRTSNTLIRKALEASDQPLMRQEIKALLQAAGIVTDVQRLAHIVMYAELDGLICSGPRRGKQFTYDLLEKRAPASKERSHDEACAELALRYFQSHGPAQVKDFAWWSGLTRKDAQLGIELLGKKLQKDTVNTNSSTRDFYSCSVGAQFQQVKSKTALAHLLSIFDEYTIAYSDRTDMSESGGDIERMIKMGNALTAVILIDGRVAGTWKRTIKRKTVEIVLSPFRSYSAAEKSALEQVAQNYGKFWDVTPSVTYVART